MKNLTISAHETVLEQARLRARTEHRTLNELIRQWLEAYVTQPGAAESYNGVMKRLSHVSAGRRFSREEMHERR